MAFIELDELRRLSKSGIKFPNQVPIETTMFGHKCSVYGFFHYRRTYTMCAYTQRFC